MADSLNAHQLVLSLPHTESFARDDFIAGPSNTAALALIDRWPDWPDDIVALAGPEGSGKSHLAAIWAQKAGARFLSGRALADANLPTALATGALVVEDIAPSRIDEVAFFHLLNLARQERAQLLLTARTAPVTWPVVLRDLASRLRALPAVGLSPPDDFLLRGLMVKLAADRQMELDDALLSFLAHRVERSFSGARLALTRLDCEAMRQHRPITRALAAELFRNEPA